jgi:hypothetical protein
VEDFGMRGTMSFWGKGVSESEIKEIFLVLQKDSRKAHKHSKNAYGENF